MTAGGGRAGWEASHELLYRNRLLEDQKFFKERLLFPANGQYEKTPPLGHTSASRIARSGPSGHVLHDRFQLRGDFLTTHKNRPFLVSENRLIGR